MNKTSVALQARKASFLPPVQGILQRKCACGNHTMAGEECAECAKKKSGLQRKFAFGASNDPLEHEADRVADQVMAASAHSVVSGAPPRIQRYAGQSGDGMDTTPASVDRVLAGSGRPLEPTLRQDMEQRFGHDFSRVRVYSGETAEQSARDVNAHAYTVGHDIVFGAGRFSPETHDGRRLIAHELTHVVQQSISFGVQKNGMTDSVLQRSPSCARPASCPAEFCLEYSSRAEAESHRAANRDQILSLVGQVILDGGGGEVRRLYGDFLDGGHAHRDLSDRLASFFTRSSTTGRSIRFLDQSLEEYFRANPPPPGRSTIVNIQDAIPNAIAALGTPGNPNVMAFRDYTETPGVLAGGVGVGQVDCSVGAIPSNVEDRRSASGTATGTNSNGTILVSSSIQFTVTDTLDFCPGNCGGENAQEVTVPLSRYEATGISGDEPFTVTFSAPVGAFDSEG